MVGEELDMYNLAFFGARFDYSPSNISLGTSNGSIRNNLQNEIKEKIMNSGAINPKTKEPFTSSTEVGDWLSENNITLHKQVDMEYTFGVPTSVNQLGHNGGSAAKTKSDSLNQPKSRANQTLEKKGEQS